MTDLAIDVDGDGDLVLEGNELRLNADTSEAAAQDLRRRFLQFRGEWFLDQREGTPWFRDVFRKGFSPAQVRTLVRRVARSSPYVEEVLSATVEVDSTTRTLTVDDLVARRVDGAVQEFPRFVLGV